MINHGRQRVIIEKVHPEIDGGIFPIKRIVGEDVMVQANIFADGHDEIETRLLYRTANEEKWREQAMVSLGNDVWQAKFLIQERIDYFYTIEAWIDDFSTWKKGLIKKHEAKQDISIELLTGVEFFKQVQACATSPEKKRIAEWIEKLNDNKQASGNIELLQSEEVNVLMKKYPLKKHASTYHQELRVRVDREKALFSTWYEFFPRSWSPHPGKHGTFKDCERLLPEIARMGFDIVYFPPIHPIGTTKRKGKNNTAIAQPDDSGSPWAIGSKEGGHKAIHAELGTLDDFKNFIKKAKKHEIEVALDLAFQCSPDHPYVSQHPEWFIWRPDGTVQCAENPPKKYEDVLPLNFETDDWKNLWQELKSIVEFWIEQGVVIFRVDNPHTKPFVFWDWLIAEIRKKHPHVMFLAEAFTRPKVMQRLAKGGFDQSYTYFTWRNTKQEFIEYMNELTKTEVREFFRPGFWTNTPDILPQHLQYGGRPAFMMRLVLAGMLSSSYGIYGPVFELCVNQAIQEGKEEYLNSEKYEIKQWDWNAAGNLKDFIARFNQIRKQNAALQTTCNVQFCDIENHQLLAFIKKTADLSNVILVIVNLDPFHTQAGWVHLPVEAMGIDVRQPYLAYDLLSNDRYIWHGYSNYVELNPYICPAHILQIRSHLHREQDFDYYL